MKKIRFIITIALLTVASYGYAELDNSPFNNQVATQNSLMILRTYIVVIALMKFAIKPLLVGAK